MTRVVDASAVVAALVDVGDDGAWADARLTDAPLAAPHLMPVEAANILRRAVIAGAISADVAVLAHADLLALPIDYFPYAPFAARVWELTANLTTYDAWYVALAESLDATLTTLDRRTARAPGPRCRFDVPET